MKDLLIPNKKQRLSRKTANVTIPILVQLKQKEKNRFKELYDDNNNEKEDDKKVVIKNKTMNAHFKVNEDMQKYYRVGKYAEKLKKELMKKKYKIKKLKKFNRELVAQIDKVHKNVAVLLQDYAKVTKKHKKIKVKY